MTADILDQQAVQIEGCGGARIEPALAPRRPPPPAPIRAPALAPEFDQIGVFLRTARTIPGLLWRDRIHSHLPLLEPAPSPPHLSVKHDFHSVCTIFPRHLNTL